MATKTLTAVYADGVFRPSTPVDLPEQTVVKLVITDGENDTKTESTPPVIAIPEHDRRAAIQKYFGSIKLNGDSVEWQRHIRDTEWN